MKKLAWITVAGLLLALGTGISWAQSGYDLFQKALAKERAEGNIHEAIQLYQRIVKEHGVNRALAAKALVAMGQCYEKLGRAEARRAYERVVREYADQSEQASEARTRLAALSPAPNRANGSMVARRVFNGEGLDTVNSLSPDGRYLSFVDWETGDLALRELATGEMRTITNKRTWNDSPEHAEHSAFSQDGRQIAYGWSARDGVFELRTQSLQGSSPRVLYRNPEVDYVQPEDWTPDARQILTLFRRKDRTHQVALVSLFDGSARILKTLDWRMPTKMRFSPDGRYVAYDLPATPDGPNRDIYLLSSDATQEIPLVQHSANDVLAGWTPDGKRVLFTSDRTGSTGAWAVAVADGKAKGAPELVKADIGRVHPIGFNRKGAFYYILQIGMNDVYTASVDLTQSKVVAPPVPVTEPVVGVNHGPDWSADGRYLAYLSIRQERGGPGGRQARIVVRSLESGEERELVPELQSVHIHGPRWSPDGNSFLVIGRDGRSRYGVYRVNAQTGAAAPIVLSDPRGFMGFIHTAAWSHDGRAIFFANTRGRIAMRDLETGQDKELARVSAPLFGVRLALSPDGRLLALTAKDTAGQAVSLKVMPAAGGEAREIFRVSQPEEIRTVAWTPDGKQFLITRGDPNSADTKWHFLQVSLEGGRPREIGLAMDAPRGVRVHPDGRRIVFGAGKSQAELWVLENFLPGLRAAK